MALHARFISEFSRLHPWVADSVVAWMAQTPHQRLSTREHALLWQVKTLLDAAQAEDARLAELHVKQQQVEAILEQDKLVSKARAMREEEVLSLHTPAACTPPTRPARL